MSTTMLCPEGITFATLAAWHDTTLDGAEAARMGAHVAECAACRAVLNTLETQDNVLRQLPTPEPDDRLWREMRMRMQGERPARRLVTPSRGRFVSGIAAVAAVLLVALGFAQVFRDRAQPSMTPTLLPSSVELPLFRDEQTCGGIGQSTPCTAAHLFCPTSVAWSSDEKQVAILSDCDQFQNISNKIAVYDATNGHLLTTIGLDDLVTNSTLFPSTCDGRPETKVLTSYDLFWLPSGHLAVVGSVALYSAQITSSSCAPWDALILMNADGTHAQLARVDARAQATDEYSWCGRTWDLLTASPSPASAAGDDCPLTPALGYNWAAGGSLQPQTPLNGATAPSVPGAGPVGNPDGGAQFTVWQSAMVMRSHLASSPGASADFYQLFERLGAFSPGGQYGYGDVQFSYRLEPAGQPTPSPEELQQAGATNEPLLPVKDAALQHVLAALPQPVTSGGSSVALPTAISWRPDGSVLAALGTDSNGNGGWTDAQQSVQLLNTANGSVRLSLTPLSDPDHKQVLSTSLILSWSPDGSHLLLISGARGTATLWNLTGLH